MDKELLGKFIADTRRQQNLTQQDLAAKIHVTSAAVSKWERGLCYPDLTTLEPLATALGLSVSELMTCGSHNEDAEQPVRTILDVAESESRLRRAERWRAFWMIFILALLLGSVCLIGLMNARETGYLLFVHKQVDNGIYYVYAEENSHLVRLRCRDQETYSQILADGDTIYKVDYTLNHLTQHGTLNAYELTDVFRLHPGRNGSIIGVDSLLGIDFVWQEYVFQYPDSDPQSRSEYLFTYAFFYYGDGKSSYLNAEEKQPRTDMFRVDACRAVVPCDYDGDGIVELFVWTRFKEEPYMVYELVNGSIESRFISKSQVPEEVLKCFY